MKIPWQTKVIGKVVLSRIPLGYRCWRRLGVFQHGKMQRPEYALRVFQKHFDHARFSRKAGGFRAMELGPGDTLFSVLIARAYGAEGIQLIDVGRYASEDLTAYGDMLSHLHLKGLGAGIRLGNSLQEMLRMAHATYATNGLDSLRIMPAASIDFVWSQAVLEHVRRREFTETVRELRRIIRQDGVCSHRVDLSDHLDGGLNNLRWKERYWESDFLAASGFYTNRLRFGEMLTIFKEAGFCVEVVHIDRWERLPTPRKHLAKEFRYLPDEELLISGFDVLLRPK